MKKRIPKTELVKRKLIEQLKSGIYREGDTLPSVEQLGKQLKVSKNTISIVLSQLNDENVVQMAHGKATRVTDRILKPHVVLFSGIPYNMQLHEFWGDFYLGVKEIFDADGRVSYDTYASTQLFSGKLELRYLPPRVDAFILFGVAARHEIDHIASLNIPTVDLYEMLSPTAPQLPSVSVDFQEAFRNLANDFADSGVRTCGYIGHIQQDWRPSDYGNLNRMKYDTFCAAMKGKNIEVPPETVINTGIKLKNGYEAIHTLHENLQGKKYPDALFLTSDILAPGAYKALKEQGLRIPDDIQIAGCDSMDIGTFVEPELTTIDPDRTGLGRTAAKKVLSAIFDHQTIEGFIPNAKLIIRNSTQRTRRF